MKLTVYYDGQFWVGVVEEVHEGKLRAGRYVFGSEPNDSEILEFIQRQIVDLTNRLSQEINRKTPNERRVNPKRLARRVADELKNKGISSHAEETLKLEYEKRKKEKQTFSRQQREEMKERKREIKRQKAKDKHRGR
ncbi:YjdF family protein [Brevibacillus daliensis]|uniref:YjdF family protein n=1 Tax=Brevibacillus daliensis TaxID=2892995 RepID=UPI001E48FC6C|nr:YjdF family protein [Brevibacillus daliensis]